MTFPTFTAQMDEMLRVLDENNIGTQPVTFPARALFMGDSLAELQYLLAASAAQHATITIWGTDEIEDIGKLRSVIDAIGRDVIYIDVPADLKAQLVPTVVQPTTTAAAGVAAVSWSLLTACVMLLSS